MKSWLCSPVLDDRSRFGDKHFLLPSPAGSGAGGEGDAFLGPEAEATQVLCRKSAASVHVRSSTLTPALSRRERERCASRVSGESAARPPFRTLSHLAALLLSAGVAVAQPSAHGSDSQAMAARPLMVGDLPVGTVTVRVGRGSLSNAAVGVQVEATVTAAGGKVSKRTEETKADGRATFSGLPAGAQFHAEVVVDGERLQTESFAIPAQGGARLMLLSSEGEEAPAPANPHAGGNGHGGNLAEAIVDALLGTVAAKDGLAAGTLELRLVDPDGAAIADQELRLGRSAGKPEVMTSVTSSSDKNGFVRFEALQTGDSYRYTAVIDRDGLRLHSATFSLSADHGAAGELRVPGRTSDSSVLQISNSSKLLIDLREDALAVMENLVLENTSDKIFQAGPAGLAVPLPAGANNLGALEGGAHLELSEGATMFLREAVPPHDALGIPVQARFGFFLPTTGEGSITIRQPMPLGIETPVLMVPESHHLKLEAPGLQAMAPQTDDRGAGMQIFQLASVPRNGVLTLTVSGLPTRASLGKTIATVLVAALVFAALLGLRRPRVEERSDDRRERIFAELVDVERARRAAGSDDAQLAERRGELIAALEAADTGLDPPKRSWTWP